MIDINQQIILIRQSNTKPTEILLLEKIKELEKRIQYIETKTNLPYGYDINATTLDFEFKVYGKNDICYRLYYKLNNIYIEPTLLMNIEIQKMFKKLETVIIHQNVNYDTEHRHKIMSDFRWNLEIFEYIFLNSDIIFTNQNSILQHSVLKESGIRCKSIKI